MCVWSAYTGKSPAAPILWDSLKKIEGIWAGYYTGIATCHDGKILMDKVFGNMEAWAEKYDLADFPGTCGLIHSRTNSGGDVRWGHPFVGSSGKVAIISQGCSGVFKSRSCGRFEEWGNEMLANGKVFSSGIFDLPKRYPVLSDGGQVHSAEVAAQSVEYWYEKLGDPLAAIKQVLSDTNTESASFFIFADRPGVIGFSNANQHVVYQRTADGVYLSITSLGLPGRCGMELPCNSVGIITPDEIKIERLNDRYETDMNMPSGMIERSLEYIKANPGCHLANVADHPLKELFTPDTLNYRVGAAYRVLETLILEEKVRMEAVSNVGPAGNKGTSFKLYAVEK